MCASPLLIRLIAVQVLIHASMTGMRMAAPLLVLRQGHSAIAAGALISLFALAPVFFLFLRGVSPIAIRFNALLRSVSSVPLPVQPSRQLSQFFPFSVSLP